DGFELVGCQAERLMLRACAFLWQQIVEEDRRVSGEQGKNAALQAVTVSCYRRPLTLFTRYKCLPVCSLSAGVAAVASVGPRALELCAACLAPARRPIGERAIPTPLVVGALLGCPPFELFPVALQVFGAASVAVQVRRGTGAIGARITLARSLRLRRR